MLTLKLIDKNVARFEKDLDKVMAELNGELQALLISAKSTSNTIDAAIILNSRPQMVQALQTAGFNELAQKYVGQYPAIAESGAKEVAKIAGVESLKFSQVSADSFAGLSKIDLEGFAAIGEKAIDDIRLAIYKDALANVPIKDIVDQIAASTVGLAKNNSPLRNYAYTHANTAILKFNGEVLRTAGEELGADKWEVVGPNDEATREVCRNALADPVRTEAQWKDAGYWGGSPGGWNCRHQLYPYFD